VFYYRRCCRIDYLQSGLRTCALAVSNVGNCEHWNWGRN